MTTITANMLNKDWIHAFTHAFKHHRLIQILGGLLALQILVTGVVGLQGLRTSNFEEPEPLFSFAEDSVTELEISDSSQTIQLFKREDAWFMRSGIMGSDMELPVDDNQIASLTTSLVNLDTGLPVASSKNARDQLQVADNDYQRKLSISTGDKTTVLLLGTSPGIRKSHIRLEGSDNIHSASLPVSDVPTSVDTWLDKSLLAISGITKIKANDVTFELRSEGVEKDWTMVDEDSISSAFDTEKLVETVSSLENMRVNGVGENLATENTQQNSPEDSLSTEKVDTGTDTVEELVSLAVLLSTDSTEITLELQRLGDKATANRSDIDGYYTIPTSLFDRLSSLGTKADWIIESSDQDGGDS